MIPLQYTKQKKFLKNVGNKTLLVTIAFHFMDKKQTFLKISLYSTEIRKSQIWNDMRKIPF